MPKRSSAAAVTRSREESLVNLNARIPKHLWRRVRLQCLREERLLRAFVTEALEEYLRSRRAASST